MTYISEYLLHAPLSQFSAIADNVF